MRQGLYWTVDNLGNIFTVNVIRLDKKTYHIEWLTPDGQYKCHICTPSAAKGTVKKSEMLYVGKV